ASLTSASIGIGVITIGDGAFYDCIGLRSVYFLGNAPNIAQLQSSFHQLRSLTLVLPPFQSANRATIFYRAGTSGWGATFAGRPTMLWVSTDDLDHDEMNNLDEMQAGTDPLDSNSVLAFEGAPRADALAEADQSAIPQGQQSLYFQTIPGTRYEILSTETIGGEWSIVATVSASTSQKRVLLDKPSLAAYYRIHVLPPQ
ncbi:MAG: Cell surface protein, partial [Verrucomicrobiales bacterium]|nr:Cell surface protein [Verrucomicrobiales bacterium]